MSKIQVVIIPTPVNFYSRFILRPVPVFILLDLVRVNHSKPNVTVYASQNMQIMEFSF